MLQRQRSTRPLRSPRGPDSLDLGRSGSAAGGPSWRRRDMLRKLTVMAMALVLLMTTGAATTAGKALPSVVNPGFEADGAPVASPSGWKTSGLESADFTEAGGLTGGFRLTQQAGVPFSVDTTQKLTN